MIHPPENDYHAYFIDFATLCCVLLVGFALASSDFRHSTMDLCTVTPFRAQTPAPRLPRRRAQLIEIEPVIVIGEKHLLTAVAALRDVMREAGNNDAGKTGQGVVYQEMR
jgi:hypothetical protein